MFDLNADLPNFVFARQHRKAAYLALEYKAIKIASSIQKVMQDHIVKIHPFAFTEVDLGLDFAKAIDAARERVVSGTWRFLSLLVTIRNLNVGYLCV